MYLDSLNHLSLRQLAQLRGMLVHASGIVRSIDDTSVYLVFENDDELAGSFPTMIAEVDACFGALVSSVYRSDVNLDGTVDSVDAVRMSQVLGASNGSSAIPSEFDVNYDGFVAWDDYAIVLIDIATAALSREL